MTTTLVLHSRTDLDGGGHVELHVDVDLSMMEAADFDFVSGLVATIGQRALALPRNGNRPAVTELPPPAEPPAPPKRRVASKAASKSKRPRIGAAVMADLGVVLLRSLHEAGGEIFDPGGRATAKLHDAAGVDQQKATVLSTLAVLDEAGHISRTINGKRTSRIVLNASGLAIVDRHTGDAPSTPAAPPVLDQPANGADVPVSRSATKSWASDCLHGAHKLCAVARARCACPCHGTAKAAR